MAEREVICWNLIGYKQAHHFNEAFGLFFDMHRLGIRPSQVTKASIIQAYMETRNLKLGKFVHGGVFGLGMGYDVLVLTSLIDMNGKMGDVESAQSVFVSMPITNLISWKVMISGFVQNGLAREAVDLFQRLVLSGGGFDSGTGKRSKSNLSTAIFNLYSKCGALKQASIVFDKMKNRNVITWTAMVVGLAQNEHAEDALKLFTQCKKREFQAFSQFYYSLCLIHSYAHI
ncbi:pentatricopeptide repeat-containing protein [Quercus suber]|uniref:Pentatricopeptide repeat-containing protein n=1 Tax=Quercus suber TaxID=58331 RepID=A0AAW0LFC2_QUESU